MIPFIHIEVFEIGGLRFQVFPTMVGAGILVGLVVAALRARQSGVPLRQVGQLFFWTVVPAYFGARAASLFYRPDGFGLAFAEPGRFFSVGLSSIGGITGGILGIRWLLWRRPLARQERYRLADLGFAIPFGWAVGRIGCALVHDHPGVRTGSWLSVRYPDTPRYDLGVLEVLFLAGLCGAFLLLSRKKRPPGLFGFTFLTAYGLFRVTVEPLRAEAFKWNGWLVNQGVWLGVAALGGWLLIRRRRRILQREIHAD